VRRFTVLMACAALGCEAEDAAPIADSAPRVETAPAPVDGELREASPCVATVYEQLDFKGGQACLPAGTFPRAKLVELGFDSGSVGSVTLNFGHRIRVATDGSAESYETVMPAAQIEGSVGAGQLASISIEKCTVGFFEDAESHRHGTCLEAGSYDAAALSRAGVKLDGTRSVRVAPGFELILEHDERGKTNSQIFAFLSPPEVSTNVTLRSARIIVAKSRATEGVGTRTKAPPAVARALAEGGGPIAVPPGLKTAKHVFVIGDSLSDQTNAFNDIRLLWCPNPAWGYWEGRFTNGRNWLDYFLEDNAVVDVRNHAVGGSKVMQSAIWRPSLMAQAQKLVTSDVLADLGESVVVIWSGSNDINDGAQKQTNEHDPTTANVFGQAFGYEVAGAIADVEAYLANAGVAHFLVTDIPPLDMVPVVNSDPYLRFRDQRIAYLKGALRTVNDGVHRIPGVQVPINEMIAALISGRIGDGSLDSHEPCQWRGSLNACDTTFTHGYVDMPCPRKMFMDQLHPTSVAHCMLSTVFEKAMRDAGYANVNLSANCDSRQRASSMVDPNFHPALRVMPLGDSITAGVGSSTESSYRAELWSGLTGSTVDFVGSQRAGQLPDLDHEGHSGWLIDEIAGIATGTVSARQPNIVTLHIGTNDMNRNHDVATAPERVGSLIDQILAAAPDTMVVVSTLVPANDPAVQARIDQFNARLPAIVGGRQLAGKKVLLVDMNSVTTADLGDVLHPNDEGYRKMAGVFRSGIGSAIDAGLVKEPKGDGGSGAECKDNSGNWSSIGVFATGVGATTSNVRFADLNGDGRDDYLVLGQNGEVDLWLNAGGNVPGGQGWTSMGRVATGVGPRDSIRFADIDGDRRDDYLVVAANGAVSAWMNDGAERGAWKPIGEIATGVGADAYEIRFADVNGDRRDDYLVVGQNGSVSAWMNDGAERGAWVPRGEIAVGTGGYRVEFADIDCDERDDYLAIDPQGRVEAWINGGSGESSGSLAWQPRGVLATGVGATFSQVRFADMNGDGRDDYLVLDAWGVVSAWINEGGESGGAIPGVCATPGGWNAQGQIASGVGASASNVRFADLSGDGREDYVVLGEKGEVDLWVHTASDQWTSVGRVATGEGPRDSIRFADLNGDGRDDYLVLGTGGTVDAWINDGAAIPGSAGWVPKGRVAGGVGADPYNIRFADIDGDGRDDYLVVGSGGTVDAWINNGGEAAGGGGWVSRGRIANGTGGLRIEFADINCDRRADYVAIDRQGRIEGWINGGSGEPTGSFAWTPRGIVAAGVGATSSDVRLADMNGDGLADYVVLGGGGEVSAWLNNGGDTAGAANPSACSTPGGWTVQGQIAVGVGAVGGSVELADINGDGRDDYLVLASNGAVDAWMNDGATPADAPSWNAKGQIAAGVGAARDTVRFGDVNGDGRDDYLVVDANGAVDAWINDGAGKPNSPGWISRGRIASGVGAAGRLVRFADINDDGRDDYLVVADDGAIDAWLNAGGETPGGGGWLPQGRIAQALDVSAQVELADITCDRRADHLAVDRQKRVTAQTRNADNSWSSRRQIAGGTSEALANRVVFADMNGDGLDDYVVVRNEDGALYSWLFRGGD
jgi:lysophospholipase L1-like esterase